MTCNWLTYSIHDKVLNFYSSVIVLHNICYYYVQYSSGSTYNPNHPLPGEETQESKEIKAEEKGGGQKGWTGGAYMNGRWRYIQNYYSNLIVCVPWNKLIHFSLTSLFFLLFRISFPQNSCSFAKCWLTIILTDIDLIIFFLFFCRLYTQLVWNTKCQ